MKTLNDILEEMEQEEKSRKDLNVSLNSLVMQDDGTLKSYTYGEFDPSPVTIDKLSSMYGLSNQHLNVLYDNGRPDIVAETFNHFLLNDRRIMKLRTVGGNRIKGIVSKNYKKFDDFDLFTQIGDYLNQCGFDYSLEVLNKDDEFTRIRFMLSDIQQSMGMSDEGGLDNDIVQGGFEVTNSEIGSKMGINALVYRQICTNGMMGLISDEDNKEIFYKRGEGFNPFSRRNMIDRGLNNTINQSDKSIEQYRRTKDIIVDNPIDEIRKIGSNYNLNKGYIDGIQQRFDEEKQNNMFGVVSALTRFGRDFKSDYKNRSKFEFIANDIVANVSK